MSKYIIKHKDGVSGELHDGAGTFNVLINDKTAGAQNFAMLYNVTRPGIITELHSHEQEHAMYILEGKGTIKIGEETFAITKNTAIFIPPRTPHTLFTQEKEPIAYLVLYSPQGPEKELIAKGAAAFKNDS
jgi:mannose-6-phosphate isomerase-like protein (cupin superfamily)